MQWMKDDLKTTKERIKKIGTLKTKTAQHEEEGRGLEEWKVELKEMLEQAQWWTYRLLDFGISQHHAS